MEIVEGGALATVGGRIFRLNSTALAVWQLLDNPMTLAELSTACSARFQTPMSLVAELEALVAQWQEVGLVRRD